MTERIDHAAEAKAFLGNIEWGNQGGDYLAAAQLHATLALVEQQRIANLVALGQYTIVPGDMPVYRSAIFNGDALRPDIAAALGVEA